MVKIKQKKTMNLPQLIEWGFNNLELAKSKLYLTKEHDEYSPYVQFSVDGYGVRTSQSISKDDTFTLEFEEEITEDTKLPEILLIANDGLFIESHDNSSVNDVLSTNEGHFEERLMIILKPEPTIIWTYEKGLVE